MLKDSCKNLMVLSRSKAALRGDRRTESTCKGRMNQTLQCTVLYPGLFILCANKLPPSNADGNKHVCVCLEAAATSNSAGGHCQPLSTGLMLTVRPLPLAVPMTMLILLGIC